MRLRLLRVLFALTAFAVVWLVTSRASAGIMNATTAPSLASGASGASFSPHVAPPAPIVPDMRAPLCDPRGAITFAPPPQMQDAEVTLDTGLTVDDCMTSASDESRHASRGRAPVPIDASSASSDVAVITGVAKLVRASLELLPVPAGSTECSRPGFRSTVDRPPRV